MRAWPISTWVLLAVALTAPPAQAIAAQQPGLNGRQVASELSRLLAEHYVLPELRPKFAAALTAGIAKGRYDVEAPEELANRLNADLGAVSADKHLGVMYDPVTS